jgi:hypothetical protein
MRRLMWHHRGMEMRLWIPDEHTPAAEWVLPGSALVSVACSGEQVVCSYEGNKYGAANIVTLADKAMLAAGRLRTGYPTAAVRSFRRSELVPVGFYDEEQGEIRITDAAQANVARWVGCSPGALSVELLTTGSIVHEAQRALRELDRTPNGRLQAQWLRKHGPAPYRATL